jgi:hypothetical protein
VTGVIAAVERLVVVAAMEGAAEDGGATLGNVGEGASLGWPEPAGVRGEVRRSRRADNVRQLDHRTRGRALEGGHEILSGKGRRGSDQRLDARSTRGERHHQHAASIRRRRIEFNVGFLTSGLVASSLLQ